MRVPDSLDEEKPLKSLWKLDEWPEAYKARVLDAMRRLREGEADASVRADHGAVVLREALAALKLRPTSSLQA